MAARAINNKESPVSPHGPRGYPVMPLEPEGLRHPEALARLPRGGRVGGDWGATRRIYGRRPNRPPSCLMRRGWSCAAQQLDVHQSP